MEVLEGVQNGEKLVEGPYRTLSKDLRDGDRVEQMKAPEKRGVAQG
jgi:HlyD family secretion protein